MALVGSADAIAEGTAVAFNADGKPIAVAKVGGRLFAFDELCSHLGCSLADGFVEGAQIICPCHFSAFRVTDGAVESGPAEAPIRTYPVEIVNGQISVSLDAKPLT